MPEPFRERLKMVKFRRLKKPYSPLKQNSSLSRLFGGIKPRFLKAKGKTVFAVGTEEPMRNSLVNCRIAMFNPQKGAFEMVSWGNFEILPGEISISNIENVGRITKQGYNIFRIFLNESIALARKRGIDRISLHAENEKLANYYSRFGFKFEDLQDPLYGAFDFEARKKKI